jgi:hypothetical protein
MLLPFHLFDLLPLLQQEFHALVTRHISEVF